MDCSTTGCMNPAEVWAGAYHSQAKEGEFWPECVDCAHRTLSRFVDRPPSRGFIHAVRLRPFPIVYWRPYAQVSAILEPEFTIDLWADAQAPL